MALAAVMWLSACAHPARLTKFDYLHRPAGYRWRPARTSHRPAAAAINGYYGVDPSNGWTVYVGPDGIYYSFAHRGPIAPGDLESFWMPHDADAGDGRPAHPETRSNGVAHSRPTPK
ncbi:MAG: hypothetical protein ABI346_03535 [Candidatus Baltobacteraceae bacterium]